MDGKCNRLGLTAMGGRRGLIAGAAALAAGLVGVGPTEVACPPGQVSGVLTASARRRGDRRSAAPAPVRRARTTRETGAAAGTWVSLPGEEGHDGRVTLRPGRSAVG